MLIHNLESFHMQLFVVYCCFFFNANTSNTNSLEGLYYMKAPFQYTDFISYIVAEEPAELGEGLSVLLFSYLLFIY